MSSDEREANGQGADEAHRERMKALQRRKREEIKSKKIRRGVLLVHTGDGKGKSTAAFGLALRAAGHGLRVGLIQFTKGKWKTGEQASLARFPEIDHVVAGQGFTWDTQDREQDTAMARRGWERFVEMVESSRGDDPRYHLVIADELNIVLRYGYLPVEEVVSFLAGKPEMLHVCITGRNAPPELVELADTVSEMRPVKHAFEGGIRAARGIEF